MAHREKKPQTLTELRSDLPEGLMPVLERMIAKNPNRRYQTPAEVAIGLEPFIRAIKPPPDLWRPRLMIATAVLAFLVAGLFGVGVYRIATDKGELVIQTENDDVEVVVSKSGKVVKILDTKSGKHVTLNSGEYELALKEGQEGLKLSPEKIVLKRGETVLATITTVTPNQAASKYLILPIDKVASAVSTKSLFTGAGVERLIFRTWGKQEVFGIPFDVIDPKGDSVKNAIVLYGPLSPIAREMPHAVGLRCGSVAKAIHLLSGVAGWGWGCPDETINKKKSVCMIARLHYRDGGEEDHELINGVHFCDYANVAGRRTEVPGSRLAVQLVPEGDIPRQMRYLAIQPKNPTKVIEEIEFIKGMKGDITAPVIMAVTVERPVPSAEKVGEIRRFVGHTSTVWGVALSPNGRYALSSSADNTIRLWDLQTGIEIRSYPGHTSGALHAVAFLPNGREFLSCGHQGMRLWQVETGTQLHRADLGCLYDVAVSPDGRLALGAHHDGTLHLWDIKNWREIRRFEGHTERLQRVVFSSDGSRALSGALDKTMRLWDVETGTQLKCFMPHQDNVVGVALSPDGRLALSGSGCPDRDGELILWDIATEMELRRFKGHKGRVPGVAFSPDGRFVLSGADGDRSVRLWEVATGKELHRFDGHAVSYSVVFSRDGRYALSGSHDKTVSLWRLPDLPPTQENP
jgi:hypothetical protein